MQEGFGEFSYENRGPGFKNNRLHVGLKAGEEGSRGWKVRSWGGVGDCHGIDHLTIAQDRLADAIVVGDWGILRENAQS